jgi:hypothetical protein
MPSGSRPSSAASWKGLRIERKIEHSNMSLRIVAALKQDQIRIQVKSFDAGAGMMQASKLHSYMPCNKVATVPE